MEHVVSMEEMSSRKVVRKEARETSGARYHHVISIEEAQTQSILVQTTAMKERFKMLTEARGNKDNRAQTATTSKIQKVVFLLRDHQNFVKYFKPRAVSLGPIHHGKGKYLLAEKYKLRLASEFVAASHQDVEHLYKKIVEEIKELRECFEEEVTKNYDNETLAWILFVDGCSILQYMYFDVNDKFKELNIKTDSVAFCQQDLFLLENQLPYRLLKSLMSLSVMGEELRNSIKTFIGNNNMVLVRQQSKLQQENGEREPIHLLDLLRTSLLRDPQNNANISPKKPVDRSRDWQSYRNVQELKAAGIHVKRSETSFLRSISFRKRFNFYPAHLSLPPITVDDSTGPKFLNLIAYEMCLDFDNDFGVTSYISFSIPSSMKPTTSRT